MFNVLVWKTKLDYILCITINNWLCISGFALNETIASGQCVVHACVTDNCTHRRLSDVGYSSFIVRSIKMSKQANWPTDSKHYTHVHTSHHITSQRRPLISGEPTQYGLALTVNVKTGGEKSRNAALRKICHRNWSLFVILHDKISHRGTTYFGLSTVARTMEWDGTRRQEKVNERRRREKEKRILVAIIEKSHAKHGTEQWTVSTVNADRK